MPEQPRVVRKRLRRTLHGAGGRVDVASDVNVVVSSGPGQASSRQSVSIKQGRAAAAERSAPESSEEEAT
jgi:hypothetical protein